jgi:hypothetical protein
MDKEAFMKSLSIKTILKFLIVSICSLNINICCAASGPDYSHVLKGRMSDDERAHCVSLVKLFEKEGECLHDLIVSFLQLRSKNNKGQFVPNKTPFRQYVTELSEFVDRFEKNTVTDLAEKMNQCENHNSGYYQSLVIVYDVCSKLVAPFKSLRSVFMKYVSANDKNFMAKKIGQDIEEVLSKMPIAQTWDDITTGFTRLKVLMLHLGEDEILAEIALVENKFEKIGKSFMTMNIGVSTIIAALDQKLRNNK